MTQLGTFWQGIIVVIIAIACAVLGQVLKVPALMTVATSLFAIALVYIGGGAAGKTEMLARLKRMGFLAPHVDRAYLARAKKAEL